jgi:hypothetical protein
MIIDKQYAGKSKEAEREGASERGALQTADCSGIFTLFTLLSVLSISPYLTLQ